ncbi:MAG: hypothetical protein JW996_04040 [Candidatus Cloacimonetes bacterium]|nr:hypothetical protein [Candidatus Cloacimonadota bacterium]
MNIPLIDFVNAINGKVLTQTTGLDQIMVTGGYVSDLLSDVMGNAREGQVWITIMRHLNVIAVASLVGLSAVVFARDMLPDQQIISKAEEENICLISSDLSAFRLAGKLYTLLEINN